MKNKEEELTTTSREGGRTLAKRRELSTLIGQWPNPSIVRMNASISLYNNNHCS